MTHDLDPPSKAPADPPFTTTWQAREARWSGLALIVGGAMLLAVMTHHPEPRAGDMESFFEEVRGLASLSRVVHGGALLAMLMLVFGFFGFVRVLDRFSVRQRASLVLFGFGALAGGAAGLINGFLAPGLAERYEGADLATLETVRPVLRAASEIAGLCAKASVVGWSAALVFVGWFLVATAGRLGGRGWAGDGGSGGRWLGALALLCGVPPLVSIFAGWLAVDVFGYTLFVASQVIWFVVAGWWLRRGAARWAGDAEMG